MSRVGKHEEKGDICELDECSFSFVPILCTSRDVSSPDDSTAALNTAAIQNRALCLLAPCVSQLFHFRGSGENCLSFALRSNNHSKIE